LLESRCNLKRHLVNLRREGREHALHTVSHCLEHCRVLSKSMQLMADLLAEGKQVVTLSQALR
jgi:hypothetical protein